MMPFIFRTRLSPLHFAFLYLAEFILAEIVIAVGYLPVGLIMHATILSLLLVHTSFTWHSPHHRFIMILIFAPLMRMIGLIQPLTSLPSLSWLILAASLLLLASLLVIRTLGLARPALGLTVQQPSIQLLVIPTGLFFGYIQYHFLQPQPLALAFTWQHLLIYAPILLVSTGLITELIFRGIMQSTAFESLGRFGILYVAILFAILSVGFDSFYASLPAIGLALVMGIFFGTVASRTGSIVGVALSHGLTNVVLFLVMPFLAAAGPGASRVASGAEATSTPVVTSIAAPQMAADSTPPVMAQDLMANTVDAQPQESVALLPTAQEATATATPPPTQRVTSTATATTDRANLVPAATIAPTHTSSPTTTSTVISTTTQLRVSTTTLQQEQPSAEMPTTTPRSTATSRPTLTRLPTQTPSSTTTASSTATSLPTATPRPTATPSPTATSAPALEIMEPADGIVSHGPITFRWVNHVELQAGQRLELVFWQGDDSPLEDGIGVTVPAGQQQVLANLKQLDMIFGNQFGPGEYHWGVLLVQAVPSYERLEYLGDGRTFVFE